MSLICPYTSLETEHAAGTLAGPENLYENVTKSIDNSTVGRLLPADKGTVEGLEARVEGLEEYKTETGVVINKLVSKINSLTPVSTLLWHAGGRGRSLVTTHGDSALLL